MSRGTPGPNGIAIVDKQAGWTSHDVVAKARGVLGTKKVGHSGTLDPDATGVLVLGVGRATRLLRFLTLLPKTYTCQILLGTETSTLDASGEVVAKHDMSTVTLDQVVEVAKGFLGEVSQVPPMVSAIKVDGRRLYEIAREGGEVERAARSVMVHRFDVTDTSVPGAYKALVECSSGTHVRSLAADLGTALGGGAHLDGLRRLAVGPFSEAEATSVERIDLLPMAEAFRGCEGVVVDEEVAGEVAHGKVMDLDRLGATGTGPWPVHAVDGSLIAVYELHRDKAKPTVVLVG